MEAGAKMRLFVAIDFPGRIRDGIRDAVRGLRRSGLPIRWSDGESYHITLKFIGSVRADRRQEMRDALRRVAASHGPFELRLEGLGAFPSPGRPRIVWLGADRPRALREIKRDLERVYAGFGIEEEVRPFRPHVTLGRVRRKGGARRLGERLASLADGFSFRETVSVSSLELMRSRTRPGGAVYSSEATVPLGAAVE